MVLRVGKVLLLLLGFVHTGSVVADTQGESPEGVSADSVEILANRARHLDLANHPEWLALLHYHPSPLGGKRRSQVSDPRFFLSPVGRQDAYAELDATLSQLFGPAAQDPDADSPICRFIQRRRWLSERLQLPLSDTPRGCQGYWQWHDTLPSAIATLAFPASYLNSPSSMFGHTLLRLDPENVDEDSSWLSWSLNFAADTGADVEHSVGYAIKGITGAYPGVFQTVPYFRKLQEYGAIENRDIWEYRLNLHADEMRRMIDHVWELQGMTFDYYFFRQNCSFRLLELLEVARPGIRLTERFRLAAIPIDTIRAVIDAELVSQVAYRPSKGTRIEQRLAMIPVSSRHLVEELVLEPNSLNAPPLSELGSRTRAELLLAANELLIYRTRKAGIDAAAQRQRFDMLQQVARLPEADPLTVTRPPRPESGHAANRFEFGVERESEQNRLRLGYRLSFHDTLDNPTGYLPGAGIELGELELVIEGGDEDRSAAMDTDESMTTGDAGVTAAATAGQARAELRLERLGVVRLRALSPTFKAIRKLAWQVDVDFSRHPLVHEEALGFRAEVQAGRVFRLGRHVSFSTLAGPSLRLYAEDADHALLNLHARAGLHARHRAGISELRLELDALEGHSLFHRLTFAHQTPLGRQQGLRFSVGQHGNEGEHESFARIALMHYFGQS